MVVDAASPPRTEEERDVDIASTFKAIQPTTGRPPRHRRSPLPKTASEFDRRGSPGLRDP